MLLLPVLILSGCFGFSFGNEPVQGPDVLGTRPGDWQLVDAADPWTLVNIDADLEQEYLLFYTYDNLAAPADGSARLGPTGVAVYDLQNNTEDGNRRDQPGPSYTTYRVLPNYWRGADTGFVAEPGKQSAVKVQSVYRQDAAERITTLPPDTPNRVGVTNEDEAAILGQLNQELIIEGGDTTISVVWWRNLEQGYGVASVHAAAGFRDKVYFPSLDGTTQLQDFSGLHPFHDRSQLCHMVRYVRTPVIDAAVSYIDIRFDQQSQGIRFCRGLSGPDKPFYPEGVVLAALLRPTGIGPTGADSNLPELLAVPAVSDPTAESPLVVTSSTPQAMPDAVLSAEGRNLLEELRQAIEPATRNVFDNNNSATKIISGLYGPHTVPFRGSKHQHSATVCIEVIDLALGTLDAYSFHLQHWPADYTDRRTDEWRIDRVEPIPRADTGAPGAGNGPGPAVNCADIIPNGTPGRVTAQ